MHATLEYWWKKNLKQEEFELAQVRTLVVPTLAVPTLVVPTLVVPTLVVPTLVVPTLAVRTVDWHSVPALQNSE